MDTGTSMCLPQAMVERQETTATLMDTQTQSTQSLLVSEGGDM